VGIVGIVGSMTYGDNMLIFKGCNQCTREGNNAVDFAFNLSSCVYHLHTKGGIQCKRGGRVVVRKKILDGDLLKIPPSLPSFLSPSHLFYLSIQKAQ
jgi:hypothetical protein